MAERFEVTVELAADPATRSSATVVPAHGSPSEDSVEVVAGDNAEADEALSTDGGQLFPPECSPDANLDVDAKACFQPRCVVQLSVQQRRSRAPWP